MGLRMEKTRITPARLGEGVIAIVTMEKPGGEESSILRRAVVSIQENFGRLSIVEGGPLAASKSNVLLEALVLLCGECRRIHIV